MRRAAQRDEQPGARFARFIRGKAPSASRPVEPPVTLDAWEVRLGDVRDGLTRSFGKFPGEACPLDPQILGTIHRDGYAIERLTFQSRPGVLVTANLYRPDPAHGRHPALLSVHGHWSWARMDPHVQPRCIALAKMGYVVLSVDAFGAGERAVVPGAGTYHGALVGASLWPVGTPLIGLQVYDNRRAVDYLISRPEVDPTKLAITGASGGGNQSLYAGATDERLAAVVPVCGVGTYEAYLSSACCICEVNVGGLTYAVTGDLLAMVAPRALLVISATRDAFQFSVAEASKSIEYARSRFQLLGQERKLRQVAVDSGHDYNRTMREAMYGWLDKWLRGKGDGSPVAEPELKLEDPATLRCYPDASSRPKTVVTIPQFARMEGLARLAALPAVPDHQERWKADALRMTNGLRNAIFSRYPPSLRDTFLGGLHPGTSIDTTIRRDPKGDVFRIRAELGIELEGKLVSGGSKGTALFLADDANLGKADSTERLTKAAYKELFTGSGLGWMELGLRALGSEKPPTAPIVGVADHDEAEWSLWVGRPLLGQWVLDTIRWMSALDDWRNTGKPLPSGRPVPPRPYVLSAAGPLSLVALVAAALDPRVEAVFLSGCPVSFVAGSDRPWSKIPMGLLVPNLLDVADVAQIAALIAPRQLVISDGMIPEGEVATPEKLQAAFDWTAKVYRLLSAEKKIAVGAEPAKLPKLLAK